MIASNALEMLTSLWVPDNVVEATRILVFAYATVIIGAMDSWRWCFRLDASVAAQASATVSFPLVSSRFSSLGVEQEFLLKRTTGLSAIARAGPGKVLADLEAKAYAIAVLDELNASTPVAFEHKEKGAATAVLSMLSPSALQVHCVRVQEGGQFLGITESFV